MNITPEIRRRLGARRALVTHLIRYEMRMRGYTDARFAREIAGCSGENVRKTVTGRGHSALVLDGLKAIGVPRKYLFDPRDYDPRDYGAPENEAGPDNTNTPKREVA